MVYGNETGQFDGYEPERRPVTPRPNPKSLTRRLVLWADTGVRRAMDGYRGRAQAYRQLAIDHIRCGNERGLTVFRILDKEALWDTLTYLY